MTPARSVFSIFVRAGVLLGGLLLAGAVLAEEVEQIDTDRPDFVESSAVVGKGRVQIETGLALARNQADGRTDRLQTTPTLLRLGFADDWELRVETDGRTILRSQDLASGLRATTKGYSDVALGVKWHVLDAAGDMPSAAILLHADLDSGSPAFRGQGIRPSLRVTQEWELPDDIALGVMEGFILDKNERGERFTGGIFGITASKRWGKKLSTFVELATPQIASAKNGGSTASFDYGVTYLLTDTWQLDAAIFKGLNKQTPDITYGVGISARF